MVMHFNTKMKSFMKNWIHDLQCLQCHNVGITFNQYSKVDDLNAYSSTVPGKTVNEGHYQIHYGSTLMKWTDTRHVVFGCLHSWEFLSLSDMKIGLVMWLMDRDPLTFSTKGFRCLLLISTLNGNVSAVNVDKDELKELSI